MGSRCAVLCALLALPLAASAATDVLPVKDGAANAGAAVTVLDQRTDGYQLRFELFGLEREAVTLDGQVFDELSLPDGGAAVRRTRPPCRPSPAWSPCPTAWACMATVTAQDLRSLGALSVSPVPAHRRRASWPRPASTWAPTAPRPPAGPSVTVGEPALMHGLRVVPVTFQPVGYDPPPARSPPPAA